MRFDRCCNKAADNEIHIFLVDDASTDGTAQAARAAAIAEDQAQNLTIVHGSPLPPGWSGKLWAMQQGIEQAAKTAPDFFLFTDADIEHAPDSVATLVSIAQAGPYDMASFMVKLHCQSVAEKLLIPAFVYFFFKLYPPAWIANPRRSEAGAAGGCILIRPAALEKAGGIAAIRQEVIDDCSLAARVKRNGGRLWLGASATTRSIRPYEGFSGIGRMISRSAFSQLRHSNFLLLVSIIGMAATYLLPPALVLAGTRNLACCSWRHGMAADGPQLLARAAPLPSQSFVGIGSARGGGLLCGSYVPFSLEILDGSRRRMERQDSGS